MNQQKAAKLRRNSKATKVEVSNMSTNELNFSLAQANMAAVWIKRKKLIVSVNAPETENKRIKHK